MRMLLLFQVCLLALAASASAQVNKPADFRTAMETEATAEARLLMKEGQRLMAAESFAAAEQAFYQATVLDPLLMMAHYGLGSARMALRNYDGAASAFENARDAFGKRLARDVALLQRSEANRQQRIQVLRDKVRRAPEGAPSAGRLQSAMRVQRQEAEAELAMLEGADQTGHRLSQPPPGLFLALGSAYFRSGRLADAEREYRATIAVQPKCGEARVNLAVVLLMTGRPTDAREQLKLARKRGYKVPAGLETEVETTLAAGR